eukprot:365781-Chlamydomonas_euryale.AAC.1
MKPLNFALVLDALNVAAQCHHRPPRSPRQSPNNDQCRRLVSSENKCQCLASPARRYADLIISYLRDVTVGLLGRYMAVEAARAAPGGEAAAQLLLARLPTPPDAADVSANADAAYGGGSGGAAGGVLLPAEGGGCQVQGRRGAAFPVACSDQLPGMLPPFFADNEASVNVWRAGGVKVWTKTLGAFWARQSVDILQSASAACPSEDSPTNHRLFGRTHALVHDRGNPFRAKPLNILTYLNAYPSASHPQPSRLCSDLNIHQSLYFACTPLQTPTVLFRLPLACQLRSRGSFRLWRSCLSPTPCPGATVTASVRAAFT